MSAQILNDGQIIKGVDKITAASQYSEMGYIVHPVAAPKYQNKTTGKAPIPKGWTKTDVPMTETAINRAWAGKHNLNIGMLAGKRSGITVLDLDDMLFVPWLLHGIDDSNFVKVTRDGADRGHIYFKYVEGLAACKKHLIGIEVLSDDKNNVIVPPSMHYSGTQYRWSTANIPALEVIPEMPVMLKNRLLALFARLEEYEQTSKRCRPCIREFLKNPAMLHGAQGRMQMLQISAELMANGASADTIDFFAHTVYRDDYNPDVTRTETEGIDPTKPPKCETLESEYPDMAFCVKCNFRGQAQAPFGGPIKPKVHRVLPAGHKLPEGFDTKDDTTLYSKKGKGGISEPITLCDGHVAIVGKSSNLDDGDAWVDISFKSSITGAKCHELITQRAALSRNGIMSLADRGLNLIESNAPIMNRYISDYLTLNGDKIPHQIMVNTNGWKGDDLFVCGDRGIKINEIIDVSPTDGAISTHMRTRGTFEAWAHGISDIMKFEIMRLKMYVALTGPFLEILNVGPFVMDQYTDSGQLKTETGNIAMSAYGDPAGLQQSANTTLTAIERKSVLSCDCCVFLDETSTASSEFMENFVYFACNGRQKGRGTKDGKLVGEKTFRCVFLTTGEKPIISNSSNGGIDARLIEYGKGIEEIYEDIEEVKQCIAENHGHALEKTTQFILNNRDLIVNRHSEITKLYNATSAKERRKARQFAAVATTGEIVDDILSEYVTHEKTAVEVVGDVLKYTAAHQTKREIYIRALGVFMDWYTSNEAGFLNIRHEPSEDEHISTRETPGFYDDTRLYVTASTLDKVLKTYDISVDAIKEMWIKRGIARSTKNGAYNVFGTRVAIASIGGRPWLVTLVKHEIEKALGDGEQC